MGDTKISWATKAWNVTEGCTPMSEGCRFCFAKRIAPRLGVDFSKITLHPERLEEPLRWRKPQRVFVASRSDLFHEKVPEHFITRVFKSALFAPEHTYLFLTKRADRMAEFMPRLPNYLHAMCVSSSMYEPERGAQWPPKNWWLNVSVENQEQADKRIHFLLQTPAAVRGVSLEPLIGAIDLHHIRDGKGFTFDALSKKEGIAFRGAGLDWVVVGGESGPHHRPMELSWLRSIVDQCQAASVPVWVKQTSHARPGQQGDIPDELWRIKEYPDGK